MLGIAQVGGELAAVKSHSTVSRVSFGVDVSELTKNEEQSLRNDEDLKLY